MKKFSVFSLLAVLMLTLAMAFTACSSGDDPYVPPGPIGPTPPTNPDVLKTVFDLETDEGIQAFDLGPIPTSAFANNAAPLKPLVRAGGDSDIAYEIVDNAGKKAIQFTTSATWGAGIDLPNSEFGFRAGDEVTVTGTVVTKGNQVDLNAKPGGQDFIDTFKDEGDFELNGTLTDDNIKNIKGASPSAIRIEGRDGGVKVIIKSIKVVGMRPSTVTTTELDAPVLSLSGSKVVWEAVAEDNVDSYKITVKKEGDADDDPPYRTASAAANSLEYDLSSDTNFPTGTYIITVIAAGVKDVTTDSPASAAIKVKKIVAPEAPTVVDVSGVKAFPASGPTLSDKSESAYTIEISEGYGGSYAYFPFTFTGGDKLSSFSKITFTITGVAGDIGYKNVGLFASKTEFSQGMGNYIGNAPDATNAEVLNYDLVSVRASATNYSIGPQYNLTANTAINASVNLNPTETAKYDTSTSAFFSIYFNAGATGGSPSAATKFTISNVKFIKAAPNSYEDVTE